MIGEFYFLYTIALVWIVAAIVQDFRTREVPNWLSFSLIGFVLAYRGFYAIFNKDVWFFVWGVLGVLFFVALAYGFYYSRAFAGGDAKLLMGLGGIFPYSSFSDLLFLGLGFVFLLFASGAVYSLAYTFFLVSRNWESFRREFKKQFVIYEKFFFIAVFLAVILQAVIWFYSSDLLGLVSLLLVLLPFLFIYARSIERSCMVKLVSANKLTEGDWLEHNVKVGNRIIKKSVHGLSEGEILFLRKHKQRVLIKEGIPFTPAFLFALGVMVYVLTILLR